MSIKAFPVLGGLLVAVLLGAVAVQSCGGSNSSTPSLAMCNQTCDTFATCFAADAGAEFQGTIAASCKSNACARMTGAGGSGGITCTNQAAINTKAQECFGKTACADLLSCVDAIPDCQMGGSAGSGGAGGSTGAGGTGGAGGSTGAGGTGGTNAGCSVCTKAATCCTALAGGNAQAQQACAGYSEANCNAAGAQQQTLISVCQQVLAAGASLPACQ